MARQLTKTEIDQLLRHISTKRHAHRDKAIFLICLYSGLTMKEVTGLEICQVINNQGDIREQILLRPDQTRANRCRIAYLSKQVQVAIRKYLCKRFSCNDLFPLLLTDTSRPLFVTQKSRNRGFTPNTLAGYFCKLMAEVGIQGASSYSLRKSYSIMLAERALSNRMLKTVGDWSELSSIASHIAANPEALKLAHRA